MSKRRKRSIPERGSDDIAAVSPLAHATQVRTVSRRTWRIILFATIAIVILFLLQPKRPILPSENVLPAHSSHDEPIELGGQSTLELPATGDITSPSGTLGDVLKEKILPQK